MEVQEMHNATVLTEPAVSNSSVNDLGMQWIRSTC